MLVYCVIYQYLSSDEACLSQSDLLKKMGLPADEFTKHWDMYSLDLPLFYSFLVVKCAILCHNI